MRYEIQSKQDLSGALLTIRFPEEQLDSKALYTIQEENPDFLVPFRYRSVDGQIECSYQISELSYLRFRYRKLTPDAAADFWEPILLPLMDCGDWFLKPFSFVMETDWLFLDRDGKTVRYLYVPSKEDCVEFSALKNMVAELSEKNPVTDPVMENKILRSIMQGFQPKAFLQMLREGYPAAAPAINARPVVSTPAPAPAPAPTPTPAPAPAPTPTPAPAPVSYAGSDDIVINLDGDKKAGKQPKQPKQPKEKPEKKAKPAKEPKPVKEKPEKKGGLFGKKKEEKELIMGAAPVGITPVTPSAPQAAPVYVPNPGNDGATELFQQEAGAYLRLVGDRSLPARIDVTLAPGGSFTIGRFDVQLGYRQSDFEFAKDTKEVSRHHAVIVQAADGSYSILDQNSKAGTYVGGQRITPNIPYPLSRGCSVSFGTAGADYIWEG